jgi:phosphohistidine phosphatase
MNIYMRHAKSAYPPGVSDFDRPLNKRGQRNAQAAAEWFLVQGIKPEMACVSSSRRTRETWDFLGQVLTCPVHFEDDLYLADAATIERTIRRRNAQSVLVLAHHPGVHDAAERVAGTSIERFPTSAIAVCENGRLMDFVIPR